MTYIAVVIIMALGTPPFQLDDAVKPTGYDTPAECWLRTSVMIREVAMRTNCAYASGLCINHPLQPAKEAPKEEAPKEKNLLKCQKSRGRASVVSLCDILPNGDVHAAPNDHSYTYPRY